MSLVSTLASIGMACGPPLVYLDQYLSIVRKRDSTGFSMDVCGVLIIANVIRIFFWFGKKFELALLAQSILWVFTTSLIMILFQLALLFVCLKFRKPLLPTDIDTVDSTKPLPSSATALLSYSEGEDSKRRNWFRPYNLWQWDSYGTYIEFIALVIGANTILYLLLHSFQAYIDTIGLVALGLESTLPIPQLLSNFQRKSLAGFRLTVLAGWLFGDAFKAIYFFVQPGNSWQFKATACFQLSIDFMILLQAYFYRQNTAMAQLDPVPEDSLGVAGPSALLSRESIRESIEMERN